MRALILVDIQNDFCLGGALAVPRGDEVVAVANRLMEGVDLVVATQDWHPAGHGSFAVNHPGSAPFELGELDGLPQVLWPAHCVQWTGGAQFHPGLDSRRIVRVFPKGTDPTIDSYSGFFDNGQRKSTGMGEWLRERGVEVTVICGLATDFCVKATVIDALRLGFRVTVVPEGCRAVAMKPSDGDDALAAMRAAGATISEMMADCPGTIATGARDR